MKGWGKKKCSDCGESTMVPVKDGHRCTLCGKVDKKERKKNVAGKPVTNKFGNVKSELITGEKFDSNLERSMFELMTATELPFIFKPEYILVPGVKKDPGTLLLSNKGIHQIKVTPDFEMTRKGVLYIVDTKGHCTAEAKLRFRMLKYWIFLEGNADKTRILFLHTKEEVEQFCMLFKKGNKIPDTWNFDYTVPRTVVKKKRSIAKKGPVPEMLARKNKYEQKG